MFRKLTFAAIIVLGSVALSAPTLAAHRGDEFDPGAGNDFNQTQARSVDESQDMRFDQVARHPDGLDGDRYWHNGECFPTAPGGCD
jgi:hypothetical protein